eukprot:15340725-Ditylum_brightwellii.AAC.1
MHPPNDLPPPQSTQLVLPGWVSNEKKVTFEIDDVSNYGELVLHFGTWKFCLHQEYKSIDILNLALMYQYLLDQQLLLSGCHSNFMMAAAARSSHPVSFHSFTDRQ